jgi:hypothetical protein
MAPTVGWVYGPCKGDLVKLCEKFRTDATASLSNLRARFVAFLRTQQEHEISAIHAELTWRGAPVEVSSVDIQTRDDPMGHKGGPVRDPGRPGIMGVGGPAFSIYGSYMYVLLGLLKSLGVVDGRSPKAFLRF